MIQRSHHISRSPEIKEENLKSNTSTLTPDSVMVVHGNREPRQRGQVKRLYPSHLSKQTL